MLSKCFMCQAQFLSNSIRNRTDKKYDPYKHSKHTYSRSVCLLDHSLYTVSLLKLSTSSMKSHKHDAYFQFTLGSLKPREFPFEFINRFHLNKGCYGMLHTPLKCNLVNFDIPNADFCTTEIHLEYQN